MSKPSLRFEQLFRRELGQAEGVKAGALAILFTLGILNGLVLWRRVPRDVLRPGASITVIYGLTAIGVFVVLLEILAWRSARWRTRVGLEVPAWRGWALAALECLLPTASLLALVLMTDSPRVFNAPAVLIYALVLTTTALRLDPRLSLFAAFIAAGSHLGMVWMLFRHGLLDETHSSKMGVHIARSFVLLLCGGAAALVAQQLRRRIEHSVAMIEDRNLVVSVFGRYLSDEIVEVLLHQPEGLRLGGQKRVISLLMTDLRGFSSITERLPPERVVLLLNHYLGAMTAIIQHQGGTIDEFIGDAILVIFGAPLAQEDHAARAVRCAVEMQRAMVEVNAWNRAHALPAIEMGVGVHTGTVVVGNIGSEQRQKYGVVGSAVNLAARIESYTVGGQVLISADCAAQVGAGLRIREEREVHPKGALQPLRILDVASYLDLELPPIEEEPTAIAPRVVRLRTVEDKTVSATAFSGELVALSPRGAQLRCSQPLRPGQDLAIELDSRLVFARVLRVTDFATLRFTDSSGLESELA